MTTHARAMKSRIYRHLANGCPIHGRIGRFPAGLGPCHRETMLAQERGEYAAPAQFVRLHMKGFRPFVKHWLGKNNAPFVV